MKSPHIAFELLVDLAESRLTPEERETALAHLDGCSSCARQLVSLNKVINLMRTEAAEDAPREAIINAVELFRARKKSVPLVRRVLATLNFDSQKSSPAFGVRSATTHSRQLLYSAGENDLDLHLTPSNETWIISGQVLGPCAGWRVELKGKEGTASVARLNELCEFILPPVSRGSYRLCLQLTGTEIEVPEFELGA